MPWKRLLVAGCLCLSLSFGLEFWAFPWSTYYGNFNFPFEITFLSYIAVALVVGLTASVIAFALSRFRIMPALGQGVMTGVLMVAALCILALLLGPSGFDIPGTRVRGIFFSEWNFLTFVSEIAFPSSAAGGLVVWGLLRLEAGPKE